MELFNSSTNECSQVEEVDSEEASFNLVMNEKGHKDIGTKCAKVILFK